MIDVTALFVYFNFSGKLRNSYKIASNFVYLFLFFLVFRYRILYTPQRMSSFAFLGEMSDFVTKRHYTSFSYLVVISRNFII